MSLKIEENKKITYKVKTSKGAAKKIIVKVKNPKIVKATLKKTELLLKGKRSAKQS